MKKTLYQICMVIFNITLPLFLLMGAVLVFGQLLGAVLGNGTLVLGLNEALKMYSIWVSSICAFSGFIMGYLKDTKSKE